MFHKGINFKNSWMPMPISDKAVFNRERIWLVETTESVITVGHVVSSPYL